VIQRTRSAARSTSDRKFSARTLLGIGILNTLRHRRVEKVPMTKGQWMILHFCGCVIGGVDLT
jgi:hypothetical protein